ncbi:MAG: hypothetical protein IH577_03145 [Deltaproteobacteria bacterium]|nr:hypothetical protein [Deltaproteobacteria bacterium]
MHRKPLPPSHGQTVYHSVVRIVEESLREDVVKILSDELNVEIPPLINIPEFLANAHQLVKKTQSVLRGSKVSEYGVLWQHHGALNLRVSPASLPRALLLYDTLIKEMEKLGWHVRIAGENSTQTEVVIYDEAIEFGIEEKVKRTDHEPTQEEVRKKAKGQYVPDVRWDFHPSGVLAFRMKVYCSESLRKKWSDTQRQRLEEKLGEILEGVRIIAATKLADCRERERKAQARAVIKARLAELHAMREAEKKRVEQLELHAHLWHRAQSIRSFVSAAREAGARDTGWISWAMDHADRVDPLQETPPQTSEKSVEEIELEKKLRDLGFY